MGGPISLFDFINSCVSPCTIQTIDIDVYQALYSKASTYYVNDINSARPKTVNFSDAFLFYMGLTCNLFGQTLKIGCLL